MPTTTDLGAGSGAGTDFVTTSFAACASFAAPTDSAPVCDECGWLLAEHDDGIAEVRALRGVVRSHPRPKRLAS